MIERTKQQRIEAAKALCAKHNVNIIPYGDSYWIKGSHVDFVCTDLSWLREIDIMPRRMLTRRNQACPPAYLKA